MNDEPDVTDYESFRIMYDDFTEEERTQYWNRENRKENQLYLESLYRNIAVNDNIIKSTQRWLKDMVDDYGGMVEEPDAAYTAKLKESLALGAELIHGCEVDTGRTRAEIAHVTRYPLYSEKRRQWYKSKEGQSWLEATKKLLKKN